jgi:hypothetical protein
MLATVSGTRGAVRPEQRFSRSRPCPVCGGYKELPQGKGIRCAGFRSDDGQWCHCTREEYAGMIEPNRTCEPPTYAHRLVGQCYCGLVHAEPAPAPAESRSRPRPSGHKRRGTVDRAYVYFDEHGRPVHRTVRERDPKGFYQERYVRGVWKAGLRDTETVLYRLPELVAMPLERAVFLPEGEKDVDRLCAVGLAATTNPMGALHWEPHYSRWLEGRRVAILEDNDQKGRERTRLLYSHLADVTASIHVIRFTQLHTGADVSDWLKAGGDPAALLAALRGDA